MKKLSVKRSECKYYLDIATASMLRKKLDKILKRDENSQIKSYMVRSVYFDSLNNVDFYTKLAGTSNRKKIRLRVYDFNSSKCKLEIKKKENDLQRKISLWITKEDASELLKGKYKVLRKYFKKHSDAIYMYHLMVNGCYRPVAMIEYNRIAYTYRLYDTRITFDMNIKSSESNFNLFDKKPLYTSILNDKIVLEVKFNGEPINFISDILKPFNLTRLAISKYCLGRKNFYYFE